jgi:metal-responsive CopG/Arc/MetJ family transcriptional regulator
VPREFKAYTITLDQETRALLDELMDQLSLPSRSAILRLAVRELAARHGLLTPSPPGRVRRE